MIDDPRTRRIRLLNLAHECEATAKLAARQKSWRKSEKLVELAARYREMAAVEAKKLDPELNDPIPF